MFLLELFDFFTDELIKNFDRRVTIVMLNIEFANAKYLNYLTSRYSENFA